MTGKSSGIVILLIATMIAISAAAWSQDEPLSGDDLSDAPEDTIRIEDAVVCQDVVDRQPIGAGDVIPKDSGKVYCFTRVVGALKDTTVTHNWYFQGALKSSVQLPVRSPNWRTWSSKDLDPDQAGQWMVEVLAENGSPLESLIFFVQ